MRYLPALGGTVLAAALLAQPTANAQQAPAGPPAGVPGAKVVAAVRHDVSRPLREIPPQLEFVETAREVRAPMPIKRGPGKPAGFRDPALQEILPAALMPSTLVNFEGVNNRNGVLPPDTNGDVGLNHYVQWVNLSFAI